MQDRSRALRHRPDLADLAARAELVASLLARHVLGDPLWSLADEDVSLAVARLADRLAVDLAALDLAPAR